MIVDAWFKRIPDSKDCYALHADVTFDEERLGTGSESTVIFRVSVKKCEVVFVSPMDGFLVDRASVRRQAPLSPQEITRRKSVKHGLLGSVKLSLSRTPNAQADFAIQNDKSTDVTFNSTNVTSVYQEQWTQSREGHDAWKVSGAGLENGRLAGPVFNAHTEPRLTLRDLRSEAKRKRDEADVMTPVARMEVRCLREDIDIYDIQFKDSVKNDLFLARRGVKEKLAVACQVLREALLQEGLSAGNLLDEPFAEITICDATIPVIDQGDKGS